MRDSKFSLTIGSREERSAVILVAVVLAFGAQMVRVHFPLSAWYLRDSRMVNTAAALLPFVLAPYVLGVLGPWVARILSRQRFWRLSAGGLLLVRLSLQLFSRPDVELWSSIAGVTCFLWFLAAAASWHPGPFVWGALLGLGLDSALKGLNHTLDWSWETGLGASVLVLALLIIGGYLLLRFARPFPIANGRYTKHTALFGLGPWLFLNWLILQNQGWVATVTGWNDSAALLLISLGNGAAIWLLAYHPSRFPSVLWLVAFLAAAVAVTYSSGTIFGVACLLALILAGHFLIRIAWSGQVAAGPDKPVYGLAPVIGTLLVGIFTFLYYAVLGIPLPVGQRAIALIAGLLLIAATFVAWRGNRGPKTTSPTTRLRPPSVALWLAALWPLVAIVTFLGEQVGQPQYPEGGSFPVRVMSYNIHSAYNTAGRQEPAEIARVIREAGADVVALQEISRGWLINGSTDLVLWLSRELEMPHTLFASTLEDPLWGNAILSRFPLTFTTSGQLPQRETLIGRGYIAAQVELGEGDELYVINTHLTDTAADLSALHLEQVEVLLDLWNGRPFSLLLGDMNALPSTAEMEYVLNAGFSDSWAGQNDPGYTAPATDPIRRIDWIFHTADLVAGEVSVVSSLASDHFPVAATLSKRSP